MQICDKLRNLLNNCYFPYDINPLVESGRIQVEYSGIIFD